MIPNLSEIFSLTAPEIVIAVTLILVVLVDLIWDKNKVPAMFTAALGLIVAGVVILNGMPETGMIPNNYMVVSDKLGLYFKFIIVLTTLFILLFTYDSKEIIESHLRQGEYYALVYGMVLGMFFLTSAVDLILIYIALELLSLSSYVLAGFSDKETRNSEAAVKYLIYGAISSAFMLFGISLIYGLTGTTNLYGVNEVLSTTVVNIYTLGFAVILIIAGIGYKISAVPFHFWTPDVYEGSPITITAYLSVASKAAGFALLIRFVSITFIDHVKADGEWILNGAFDWQTILIVLALLTMTVGNLSALWQKNIKRLLAYSSVAHAGYILLGVAVLTNLGLVSVMIYFAVYMMMNLGAFYVVMLVANKTGSEHISQFDGIGYTMPYAGVALTIFLVSLTGLPPTAGFIGKLYLFLALLDSNMLMVAFIALLNTVISLYYYVRILKHMYLKNVAEMPEKIETRGYSTVVLSLLVVPVLFFGIYWTPLIDFAKYCVEFVIK
ncbi:MAG: NADH-quinone oxidoreductase subunit N [Melioribacteraceae bacterium]|nr:MAG: NADH-quinone oxidoreductase subunit N [Melioribacteraceae bacterium]